MSKTLYDCQFAKDKPCRRRIIIGSFYQNIFDGINVLNGWRNIERYITSGANIRLPLGDQNNAKA